MVLDSAFGFGANVVGLLLGLVSLFLTGRILGPAGRGELASAMAVATLAAAMLHLSLGQVALHLLGQSVDRPALLKDMSKTLVALSVGLGLAGWILVIVVHYATGGTAFKQVPTSLLVLAVAPLPALIWFSYAQAILQAKGEVRLHAILLTLGTLVSFCLVLFALLVLRLGVTGLVASALLSNYLLAGIFVAAIRLRLSEGAFKRSLAKDLLKGSAKLHTNTVAFTLIITSDILILSHFRPLAEVGNYQLALTLISLFALLPTAVTSTMLSQTTLRGPDASWDAQKRIIAATLGIVALAAVATYFLAPIVIPLLVGPAFDTSVPLLRIMLLSTLGSTLGMLLAPQFILRGMFLTASLQTLAVACIHIAANLLVVPRFGATGAAWVMTIVFVLGFFVNLGYAVFFFEKRARARRASEE
ncbi:MAG TPA: oligosaccharide flippase family protein [Candidatus Thermoplasmatota archaeon]|nr:oligosaccharide flippase family protein [Candidatus Thermoplasmatota archaeon]